VNCNRLVHERIQQRSRIKNVTTFQDIYLGGEFFGYVTDI